MFAYGGAMAIKCFVAIFFLRWLWTTVLKKWKKCRKHSLVNRQHICCWWKWPLRAYTPSVHLIKRNYIQWVKDSHFLFVLQFPGSEQNLSCELICRPLLFILYTSFCSHILGLVMDLRMQLTFKIWPASSTTCPAQCLCLFSRRETFPLKSTASMFSEENQCKCFTNKGDMYCTNSTGRQGALLRLWMKVRV